MVRRTYAFTGRTRRGRSVSGERRAISASAAVAALRDERIVVTSITAVASGGRSRGFGRRAAPLSAVAVFTRQLSVMMAAGLPVVQSLEILAQQIDEGGVSRAVAAVRDEVEGGAGLAEAMRGHPQVFEPLYTNLVAVGEAGGGLDTVLARLAAYLETRVKLRAQVRTALVYPLAVVTVAAVVVGVIIWKVVPMFAALFEGVGAPLPWLTRVVVELSGELTTLGPLGGLLLVVGGWAGRRGYATTAGRRLVDAGLLRVPVLGDVLRKNGTARVCRTLAIVLGSGLPILRGLELTAPTAGNMVMARAIMATRDAIERGEPIAAPLRDTAVFPPLVPDLIHVGEVTGALDVMLTKAADYYEAEADAAVEGMLKLLEPGMVAVLGIVVGGIVVAMYLPIFALIRQLSAG